MENDFKDSIICAIKNNIGYFKQKGNIFKYKDGGLVFGKETDWIVLFCITDYFIKYKNSEKIFIKKKEFQELVDIYFTNQQEQDLIELKELCKNN